jgi:hypothetical protein
LKGKKQKFLKTLLYFSTEDAINSINDDNNTREINLNRKIGSLDNKSWFEVTVVKQPFSTFNKHYYKVYSNVYKDGGVVKFNWVENQKFLLQQNMHFFQQKDNLQWIANFVIALAGIILLAKQMQLI